MNETDIPATYNCRADGCWYMTGCGACSLLHTDDSDVTE